jgi:DNA topoisomerase-1
MEQAVELLDARAAKGPVKGRRRAAKPKAAAKEAAPKKTKAASTRKASKKAKPDAAA